MSKQGVIAVISGFSGAGKGTVVKGLVDQYQYALSVSVTTREPREGEQHGVHYFFQSNEEFEQMIKEDRLMEYAGYVDHYYGTPKDFVMQKAEQGIDVILEIEMQGALQIKKKFPEAVLVFITPPSYEELKKRLVGRGTETQDVIEKRLHRAAEECIYMDQYDYIVVNDDLKTCVEQIHCLIQSVHLMKDNQTALSSQIKADFAKHQ